MAAPLPSSALLALGAGHARERARARPRREGAATAHRAPLPPPPPAASLEFYGKLFGWTNKPFGSSGAMRVFESGPTTGVASVMQNPPGVPAHWLSYVVVDTLAAAYDRVKQQGGKIMVERIDVQTVGTIGVIQDNVGAAIGVFEPAAS